MFGWSLNTVKSINLQLLINKLIKLYLECRIVAKHRVLGAVRFNRIARPPPTTRPTQADIQNFLLWPYDL